MGNYLADRRIELGYTQKEVAELVGVTEATVSRWESGAIANMRRDKIKLLADALHASTAFIMTGENEAASTCTPLSPPLEDEGERALLSTYRQLNDEGRERVVDYAADLVAGGRYIKTDTDSMGKKQA